jgi:lipopolysaccharide/colanic/teichoic acid biosynthesis glycosyltransferase
MHVNSKFNPYTQENDDRIFPFGKFMRKTRIDELPQLWNVIKGDMHIIGPRAEWDILVDRYKKAIPNYQDRHFVRPGITGLAQVLYRYGRGVNDAKQKLKYDLDYIKNWSVILEFKVIWKTVAVVLGRKGL